MEIGARLVELIRLLGINRAQFARDIDVTQGNLSDWINDKKPSKPSVVALAKIREVYNVNINWLLTGEGVMFSPDSDGRFFNPGESDKEELEEISGNKAVYQYKTSGLESRTIALPMMGDISAGIPIEIHNADTWKYIEIPKAFLADKYDHYFAFMVNGRSMEPQISHGDIVVIHKRDDWYNLGDKIVAVRTSDGLTLKKIQFEDKRRQIILSPLNMEYRIIVLSEEELDSVNLIGEMVMQFRMYR